MDSGGSLSMCGHGSIGLARTLVDLGMIERKSPVTEVILDTPAGLVRLAVEVDSEGRVGQVAMSNVPAFLAIRDLEIDLPDEGAVTLDVAFGGNFFAILDAARFGLDLEPHETPRLISLGLRIRDAVNRAVSIRHPLEPSIDRVELTEFSLHRPGRPTKNCVVFAEGSVDRSPCGTGTCAKLAILAAKGKLAPGEKFEHEGITGSLFTASYEPGPRVGEFATVLPTVCSRSYVTGFNFLVDQQGDELSEGFLLGR
jgi:proline racemase